MTCGENCIECPPSPWYEIHFIYYNTEADITGFGIFYIYPVSPVFIFHVLVQQYICTTELYTCFAYFGPSSD